MKKFTSALAVAAFAASASAILAAAGDASAIGTAPPWAPGGVSQDGNAIGGLAFFDASGNQITGGSTTTAPFAKYVASTVTPRAGDTKATLFFYVPEVGKSQAVWSANEQLGLSTNYPVTGAPAPIGNTTLPVNTGNTTDISLDTASTQDFPPTSTTAGYQDVYELRVYTSRAGASRATSYAYADIKIDQTAKTWSLVFTPDAPAGTATSSTLAASATSVNTGDTVTLTDTVAPAAATGTVQFIDGTTNVGQPVAVSNGVATTNALVSTAGTHSYTAVFTPTALTGYSGSTSNAVSVTATKKVVTTSVALAVNPTTAAAYSPVTITATVNPAAAGQVKFFDAGQQIGVATVANGSASLTYRNFAQGVHDQITASFTPDDATGFSPSVSPAVTFTATAPAGAAPDVQPITADVAAGSLAITTPYTAANPLNLGTLTLSADGKQLSASAQFGDGTIKSYGSNGPDGTGSIQVVDTRAGNLDWTASAASSDLVNGNGGTINQQNVGLTNLRTVLVPGNALQSLTLTPNPAANPAVASAATGTAGLGGGPHVFANTVGGGNGTIGVVGTLTVNAPSSTKVGHYTGTITFTVV